ncbi:hypothetical protein CLM62_11955 [Streptomyces sp. SA15]|uniref:hypothetical protein n=1 Tax=Streptomyces sp. SA15 TaxID=934019 RepID=UPI000BB09121|nr:hypothetical protein [Streptomyces sp. SA15]PAZ15518.1 hypothetical protein CLM62_11955 [Streptomyces sp. SA15]
MTRTSPDLLELPGVWHRSLLVNGDGTRDVTSTVTWVQGATRYADLRQTADRPHPRGSRSLGDLTFGQLLDLARQEGFAGQLHHVDSAFHWKRGIDFAPTSVPDAGLLTWRGPMLVEKGLHAPYIEHWRPDTDAVTPCAAVELTDPQSGSVALLVRTGSWFGYARSRSEPLPNHAPLAELVAGAADLGRVREMLDCEVSLGRVVGDRWTVGRSTLPHRETRTLAPGLLGSAGLLISDTDASGVPYARRWEITAVEGPCDVLASIPAPEAGS